MTEENFWRKRMAYVIAALIFNIITMLLIFIIFYLKTGEMTGLLAVTLHCSMMTFITLIMFGKFIVGLGSKFLNLIRLRVRSERRRLALEFSSGYLLFLSFFVGMFLFFTYQTSPASLGPWWSYGMAYGLIGLSALIAGIVFAYFYAPRRSIC